MPVCQTCGSHVSEAYARVKGDNNDQVTECRHCPEQLLDDHKDDYDGQHVGGDFDDVVAMGGEL